MGIKWESPDMIFSLPEFGDLEPDARGVCPGSFGAEYTRMICFPDGRWLIVYTVYDNPGYLKQPDGGSKLQFSESCDGGKTWKVISSLAHPSRDLDNGQMLLLEKGDILLSCRSVRWQESYQLPVYRSCDGGKTWEFLSMIDENNGAPKSLGNPDKGMYEPHLGYLRDGRISVLYANEKHVSQKPGYSQIISQRISEDGGRSWGTEIFVAWEEAFPQLRPGMPVWIPIKDERYIAVYEVVVMEEGIVQSAGIYYKFSEDGMTWEPGLGNRIQDQDGGPFVAETSDGTLLVTSVSGKITISRDKGRNWKTLPDSPFRSHLWPAIYGMEKNGIVLLNSCSREEGGNSVWICRGTLEQENE